MKISPLSELITRAMSAKGLRREQVVKLVGYYYLPKGLKMLDNLISGNTLAYRHTPMVNLPKVLGVSREEFDEAVARTRQSRLEAAEDEAATRGYYNERTFRPHLWIRSSLSGLELGSICIVAFGGGETPYKHIPLPEGLVASDGSFDAETLGDIIRAHYRENKGKVPHFGDIVSYILRWKYGAPGIEFSPDGSVLTYDPQPLYQGEFMLMVGKKVIPKGLLDKMVQNETEGKIATDE